jgi:hypothetical protein
MISVALMLMGCTGGTLEVVVDDPTTGATATQPTNPTQPSNPTTTTTQADGLLANVRARRHDSLSSIIYVEWEQSASADAYVEWRLTDEDWRATPTASRAAGVHEQIVLGAPYEESISWRLVIETADGWTTSDEREISAEPLPEGLPSVSLLNSEPTLWDPTGNYLLASVNQQEGGWTQGNYWKVIVDRQGRVVWASLTTDYRWTLYMRVSQDGSDLLYDAATWWAWFDNGAGSTVTRMKIDGTQAETYDTPGLHHGFVDMPDRSVVWGRDQGPDELLERVTPDGARETIWSCRDFHASIDEDDATCWSNALSWNASSDTFVFSSPNTDTVVEVDHQTGETLRHWGSLNDSYAFDPPNSKFLFQHGVAYTPEGTLILSSKSLVENETLVREYVVDDETRTLRQIWAFGEGEGVYAETAGEAHRLPNGNTLHNYGSHGTVREVSQEGTVVWEITWREDSDRLIGRTIWIEDLYALAP